MYAARDQTSGVSGSVLLIVLLIGGTIYLFGYLRAVMHRANKDYKATKAAAKPLRKAFWSAWLAALRIGALIAVGLVLLVGWFVRDTREAQGDQKPQPTVSTSSGARHR